MLKKKRGISLLITLTFLLSLLLPMGLAFGATYNEFTGAYTDVTTGEKKDAGSVEVRQAVDEDEYKWAERGVDTVLISVTLPDGVEYTTTPAKATVGKYVYINGTPAVGDDFVSGSSDSLEIELTAAEYVGGENVGGFGQDITVEFRFYDDAALDIDSDVAGDVKARAEVVGLQGGKVAFREYEDITIARVSGDEVTITAASPKTVSVGSSKKAAKITVSEATSKALQYSGEASPDSDNYDIRLEITTPGVEFDSLEVTGVRAAVYGDDIDSDDAAIAYITLKEPTVPGMAAKVEITPYLDVSPSVTGDIKIKTKAMLADGDSVTETLTVAQAIGKVTFSVTDIKNTGGKLYAGHGASVLKESGDEAEFTIESSGGDFPGDTLIYVELSTGKFDKEEPFKVDGKSKEAKLYNDDKSAWFEAPNDDEVKLSAFKVKAASDAAAGDLVVKLSSNLGSFDEDEVVIGQLVKPIDVTVSGAPEVAYLGKAQAAGDITITEAKDGAILEDGLKLTLPEGVKFASKPSVEVTEGNIDVSASLADDDSALELSLDRKSGSASTIEITGIEYNVNRLALDGDVEVKIAGYAEDKDKVGTSDYWADTKTLATVVNAVVVSEAAGLAPAVFTIGSTTYTIGDEEQTMDVAPFIENGRTYLPMRYVAYAVGVSEDNIMWDNATATATFIKGDRVVQLTINSNKMLVNGATITMDVPAKLVSGRTMLPIRWVASALGCQVDWDEATQTVTVTQ